MFEEIKDIFKSEGVEVETTKETTENKKEKFEDIVMADGTVAQVEPEVIIGAAVVVIQDEMLVEIVEIETEPESIAEAEESEDIEEEVEEELDKGLLTEDQQRQAKKIIKSIITEKVFSKEDTNKANEEFSSRISKLEKSFESLLKLVEYLVAEPTKKKVNKAKNGFSTLYTKKSSVVDKLEKLKNINKLKK